MASGLMAMKQSRVSTTFLHPVIATLQRSVTCLVITPVWPLQHWKSSVSAR